MWTDGAMPVIRYRNLGGALVTVFEVDPPRDRGNPDPPTDPAAAQCAGCLEVMDTDAHTRLRDARSWAANHAYTCAALPRIADGAADPETFAALAEQYAQHAARLLEGRAATEPGVGAAHETRDPADAARIYVGIADVYARLAEDRRRPAVPASQNCDDVSPRRNF